jgi:chemotaxis protein methyltransferase CheR
MMESSLFRKFCAIAYEKAGIHLGDGKESLVTARIGKRMRALGIESHREYYEHLTSDRTGQELTMFLDAISTNFTHFLREPDHFDLLTREVHRRASAGQRSLTFWSAASSSGEEPYSMALTILDALDGHDMPFRILATDISTKVLDKAIEGSYEASKVEPLSRAQRAKYFLHHNGDGGGTYEIKPEVKAHLVFKRINLSQPPFPMKGPFDMIFCRNVMIYFDREVRSRLIDDVIRLLAPDGLLVVGHSESLAGIGANLDTISPSVYRRRAA